jgi:hypothetical protein
MPARKESSSRPTVIVRKKRPAASTVIAPLQPVASQPVIAKPVAPPPSETSPPQIAASVPPSSPPQASPPVAPPPADQPNYRQRQRQAQYALLTVLRDRWPQLFPTDFRLVKPFALGLHKEIQHALPEVTPSLIGRTIAFYQRGGKGAYWRALLKGGPRYALDGTPSGEVTADEQAHAKARLAEIRAWWAAKRARRPRGGPLADAPRAQPDPEPDPAP